MLTFSMLHIAELWYQSTLSYWEEDVAAVNWIYTEDKFIFLHQMIYSCLCLGIYTTVLPFLSTKILEHLCHRMLLGK